MVRFVVVLLLALLIAGRSSAQTAPGTPLLVYRVQHSTFACEDPRAERALTDPDTARPDDPDWVNFFMSQGKCSRITPSSDWDMVSAAGDLALLRNHRNVAAAPLYFRYDTLDAGHDAAPVVVGAPGGPADETVVGDAGGGQAVLPPDAAASYNDGQADRRQWESWLSDLQGDYRAGAEHWALQSTAPDPSACRNSAMPPDWQKGCEAGKLHLLASDVRRRSEPAYAQGWNAAAPAPPAPDPAVLRAAQDERDRKTPAFKAGRADRKKWDTWFSGFLGDYRTGASYYYTQWISAAASRSACQHPEMSETWRAGCEMARRKLEDFTQRRNSEALYAKGWSTESAVTAASAP